jgi:hypothetical protein
VSATGSAYALYTVDVDESQGLVTFTSYNTYGNTTYRVELMASGVLP